MERVREQHHGQFQLLTQVPIIRFAQEQHITQESIVLMHPVIVAMGRRLALELNK